MCTVVVRIAGIYKWTHLYYNIDIASSAMAEVEVDSCPTEKRGLVGESRLELIVAERAVSKSRVPAGAIPRGVNYVLGGLAG